MKIHELRIGNAFTQDSSNFIEYVTVETFDLLSNGKIIIQPVLITEKILRKLGFNPWLGSNGRLFYNLGDFSFEAVFSDRLKPFDFCQFTYHSCNDVIGYVSCSNFKYVHQLQNIYYTLTGDIIDCDYIKN